MRAARRLGTIRCQQGALNRDDSDHYEGHRICRADLEQQAFERAREREGAGQADGDAKQGQRRLWPRTNLSTSLGLAPSAIRTPISEVRRVTAALITP
jgi:hypothetical protein